MSFGRWVERVYSESDIGRGVATSTAGATGLITYFYYGDWAVAAFVTIIVFPIGRILASALHTYWTQSRERHRGMDQLGDLFEKLGSEEKAVVHAFVRHGGSVITWRECNQSTHFSAAGIESLINRDLITVGVMADGMTETFALDTQLFDYTQNVLRNRSSQ